MLLSTRSVGLLFSFLNIWSTLVRATVVEIFIFAEAHDSWCIIPEKVFITSSSFIVGIDVMGKTLNLKKTFTQN